MSAKARAREPPHTSWNSQRLHLQTGHPLLCSSSPEREPEYVTAITLGRDAVHPRILIQVGSEKFKKTCTEILRDNLPTQAIFTKVGFRLTFHG